MYALLYRNIKKNASFQRIDILNFEICKFIFLLCYANLYKNIKRSKIL